MHRSALPCDTLGNGGGILMLRVPGFKPLRHLVRVLLPNGGRHRSHQQEDGPLRQALRRKLAASPAQEPLAVTPPP